MILFFRGRINEHFCCWVLFCACDVCLKVAERTHIPVFKGKVASSVMVMSLRIIRSSTSHRDVDMEDGFDCHAMIVAWEDEPAASAGARWLTDTPRCPWPRFDPVATPTEARNLKKTGYFWNINSGANSWEHMVTPHYDNWRTRSWGISKHSHEC